MNDTQSFNLSSTFPDMMMSDLQTRDKERMSYDTLVDDYPIPHVVHKSDPSALTNDGMQALR